MNREIEFRVWSKIEKKMKYYDRDCSSPNMTLNGVLIDGYMSNVSYQYELMQYTGLKDKNGKKIYEGDIVKFTCYGHKYIDKVEYHRWGYYPMASVKVEVAMTADGDVEIIGNLYENPELVEDKNE